MGLIKCPDCFKLFSDKIAACPQCGCPIEAAKMEMENQSVMACEETLSMELSKSTEVDPATVSLKEYTSNERKAIAYGEAITKILWMKGLISLEEKQSIDEKSADIIVEGK